MFQVPLWTSTKACVHPFWSSRAPSPPFGCCLPAPCLLSLFWCPCVCVLFCPFVVLLSSLISPPLIQGAFTVHWPFPVFLLLFSCLVSASWCFGPLPHVEFVLGYLGAVAVVFWAGGIPGFGIATFLLGLGHPVHVLALSCCFMDDLLRTGHTSCLVATFHRCFEYVIPL